MLRSLIFLEISCFALRKSIFGVFVSCFFFVRRFHQTICMRLKASVIIIRRTHFTSNFLFIVVFAVFSMCLNLFFWYVFFCVLFDFQITSMKKMPNKPKQQKMGNNYLSIWMKSSALKQTATHGIVIRSNNGKSTKKLMSFDSIENVIMIVFECVYFFVHVVWLVGWFNVGVFLYSLLLRKNPINRQVNDHWMKFHLNKIVNHILQSWHVQFVHRTNDLSKWTLTVYTYLKVNG